jgi:hypothetical protein
MLLFFSRHQYRALSHHLPLGRWSSPLQRGCSSAAPKAPKLPLRIYRRCCQFHQQSPMSPMLLPRALAMRRAGSKWVQVVAMAEPSRPHLRGWKHWSGVSPSSCGLEGGASAVSSAATKLAPVGSPSIASFAIVWVTGSITAIVDLQSAALLHREVAPHLLVLLALHSLGPEPRLCAILRHLPKFCHHPLSKLVGMALSALFQTLTCRPSSLLCAPSYFSLLRIASKR